MQTYMVDLSSPNAIQIVNAMQGDTDRQIQILLYDAGQPYTVTADAVSVWWQGPGGEGNFSDGITKSGNALTITLDGNMTDVAGRYKMAVKLNRTDGSISTWGMIVCVGALPGYDSQPSGDHYDAFQLGVLAAQLQELISGSTPDANAELINIRTGWDGTNYPTAGDAVREQFNAIDAGEDVTGTIGENIAIDSRYGTERTEFSGAKATEFIDVSPDSNLYYTGTVYSFIGIAGYNDSNEFVSSVLHGDGTVNYSDYKLTIPDGVTKIRASSYNPNSGSRISLKIVRKYSLKKLADSKKLDSSESDILSIKQDVSDLKTDVSEINNDLYGGNDIQRDITGAIQSGTIIDTRYGTESSLFPDGAATGFIEIIPGHQYLYSGEVFYYIGVAGYNRNNNFVQKILDSGPGEYVPYTNYKLTIPEGVTKIRASTYRNNVHPLRLVEVKTSGGIKQDVSNLKTDVSEIKEKIDYEPTQEVREVKITVLYVSPTGNDETGNGTEQNPFATIYHANETIEDNNKFNQYVIKVLDGTYTDLQTRYAGQASGQYEGVICKSFVSYIGNPEHPEKCIISWNGATGFDTATITRDDVIDKSPFHIIGMSPSVANHVKISGFSFKCNDLRYPIHVETQGRGLSANWEISYCDFSGWEGRKYCVANGSNAGFSMPSIGMGSTCGEVGEIHHCMFPQFPTSGAMNGLSLGIMNHDNAPNSSDYSGIFMLSGATYNVHDCDLNGNGIGVRSLNSIAYNTPNQLILSNCSNIGTLSHSEGAGIQNNWVVNLENSNPKVNQFDA